MKIFFTAEYNEEQLKDLYKIGEVVKDGWAIGLAKMEEEELMEKSKDADIIVTSYDDITRKVIENAPNLKLIACTRATPVNVDMQAAKERGIPVIYTPGRNSDTTAEMTIGLMLSIARRIPMAYKALKEGKFTADPNAVKETKEGLKVDMVWDMKPGSPYVVFKGTQLKGKTLGIVGYGSIGRRVGKIARAIGMELLIYDPFLCPIDIEEVGVKKAERLEELMTNSDFITCHMKVTPQTTGIISREMIALMKPTAYFINSSRGAILDEQALIDALREKRIAGAAFDVYAKEPIASNHPYITELDNVVITPHIAGATDDVLVNHTKQIVADIQRFIEGRPMLYEYKM
ncbi:MAG TPA: 2-hydroxyacid dehydrogenase [Candidatus Anaerobutyricum faecale]|uniref:2-hydroxyacid dehydrogenase n=1 Tax=Eubacterium sp. An11 TaxID=1965542 RepID=UPI000B38967F|nr:2-hydroxyacid dehydrogenase [Eubacterium sp. An11]OUQ68945.1 dihydrofolate reductase [Eubacterium sp. An11]HJC32534.1 2-hydroxyacid dehydrogenase [Candidatus Anaerobutyricum faecale]